VTRSRRIFWIAAIGLVALVSVLRWGAPVNSPAGSPHEARLYGIFQKKLLESERTQAQFNEELSRSREQAVGLSKQLQEARDSQVERDQQLARANEKIAELTARQESPRADQPLKETEDLKQTQLKLETAEKNAALFKKNQDHSQARVMELEKKMEVREAELDQVRRDESDARLALRRLEKQLGEQKQDRKREAERSRRDLAEAKAAATRLEQKLQKEQLDLQQVEQMREQLEKANDRIAELIVALDLQEQIAAQARKESH